MFFPSSVDDNKVGNTLTNTSQRTQKDPPSRALCLSNTTLSIPRTEQPGDTETGNPRLVTGHSRKEARVRIRAAHGERMKIRCSTKE